MRRWMFCVWMTAIGGCGDETLASGMATSSDGPAKAAGDSAGRAPDNAATAPQQPQEKEVESDYEAPVATGNYVWIANPKSGRVAFVDAATLQVRATETGNAPTYLASVPGANPDTALVLNVLSQDATLLHASKDGITTKNFRTAAKASALAFSDDGRYAIAWADARKTPDAPKQEGFQELTVLDLATGTSTILAVGYRPVSVGFASSGSRAHVVTQDGVALIDVATPKVTKNVAIADDPTEDPGTRDVFVTRDGAYAFVRRDGSPTITAVSLDTGARTSITLDGAVTDLDLAPSGDRAVAVVREASQAVLLPIPGIAEAPMSGAAVEAPGESFGSVAIAPTGTKALLYTNAAPVERVTILELSDGKFRTVRLYAPVLGVFPSPDARHAVVLHDKVAGGAPGAFSLVPIAEDLPARIVATMAPPTSVAVTADHAIVTERDAASTFAAYVVKLPQLRVDRFPLASPPIAAGMVPSAKRAFVAQLHPEGRITFIDLESGVARTLTGFELSSRVVDGSKP